MTKKPERVKAFTVEACENCGCLHLRLHDEGGECRMELVITPELASALIDQFEDHFGFEETLQ